LLGATLKLRKVLGFIGWLLAGIYFVYQCIHAFTAGEIVGRRGSLYTYQDEPIMFFIALVLCLILLLGVVFLGCFTIDKKVKQFGGNYNFNTFKAIVRGQRNKSN
tara:strand:- start:832 stop:1146 length:315 start_codon:yes stop_codon:yes gene_type:complete